jgi:hypothetical protein
VPDVGDTTLFYSVIGTCVGLNLACDSETPGEDSWCYCGSKMVIFTALAPLPPVVAWKSVSKALETEDPRRHRTTHFLKRESGICGWVLIRCEKTLYSESYLNLKEKN